MTAARDKKVKATDGQRRAARPQASAWVTASAGTGKTKVLTDRVLSLLLDGTEPSKILCLTFTKAAAAEMANRLAVRLAAWASGSDEEVARDVSDLLGRPVDLGLIPPARELFARVLDAPGGMKIQTIHAFCQSRRNSSIRPASKSSPPAWTTRTASWPRRCARSRPTATNRALPS